MKRTGHAVWKGGLKDGKGAISTPDSGALADVPYAFATRFETQRGTNPEELIAAAHAACFSMALSHQLGQAGMRPEGVDTRATLTLDKTAAGWTITEIHLDATCKVPGADPTAFHKAAEDAKANCPVSRLLTGAKISLAAKLA